MSSSSGSQGRTVREQVLTADGDALSDKRIDSSGQAVGERPTKKRKHNDVVLPPGAMDWDCDQMLSETQRAFIFHTQNKRLQTAIKLKLDLSTITFSPSSGLVTWDGLDAAIAKVEEMDEISDFLNWGVALDTSLNYLRQHWAFAEGYLNDRLCKDAILPAGLAEQLHKAVGTYAGMYVPLAFMRDVVKARPEAARLFLRNTCIFGYAISPGLEFLSSLIRRLSKFDVENNPVREARELLRELRNYDVASVESQTDCRDAIMAFMAVYVPPIPAAIARILSSLENPGKIEDEDDDFKRFTAAKIIVWQRLAILIPVSVKYLMGRGKVAIPPGWRIPKAGECMDQYEASIVEGGGN